MHHRQGKGCRDYNAPLGYNFRMRPARSSLPVLLLFLFLTACAPAPTPAPLSTQSSLFIINSPRSSLMEFSTEGKLQRELPLQLPCPVSSTYPAPNQAYIALELECINGPLVQVVDTLDGSLSTPFSEADSHFLAWDASGNIYLRVDGLGNPRLVRSGVEGGARQLDLPAYIYDMDFSPEGRRLLYSFTRGLGLGSETWSADANGRHARQLLAVEDSIITFARWSPDGKRITFIRMPDSQTPFPVGELWVMEADGGSPRKLAEADAGHGYAAAWSPDSSSIAFVGRGNPGDPAADSSALALISNIQLVIYDTGQIDQVTRFNAMLIEAPQWSADGHFIAFSVVSLNDTISVWIADLVTGKVVQLEDAAGACCPAWVRK